MSVSGSTRLVMVLFLIVLLTAFCVPGHAQIPPHPPQPDILLANSPKALPPILQEGARGLQSEIQRLRARVQDAQDSYLQGQKDLESLRVAVSAIKASLAVQQLPLVQVQDLLRVYVPLAAKIDANRQQLSQDLEALAADQAKKNSDWTTLKAQMNNLQGTSEPGAWSQDLQDAYQRYVLLTEEENRTASRLNATTQSLSGLLVEERNLLESVLPQLQRVEETWKVEVLKREARVPFTQQVAQAWGTVTLLPARVEEWFTRSVHSGRLLTFLNDYKAPLLGLLAFLVLLGWAARRLNKLLVPRLSEWQSKAHGVRMKAFLRFTQILISSLFLIGFTVWLSVTFLILGVLQSAPALIVLSTSVTLVMLLLATRSIEVLFSAHESGGVLALESETSRFYRKALKAFSAYTLLGILGLVVVEALDFQMGSIELTRQLFEIGLIVLLLWVLRRQHLERLVSLFLAESAGLRWKKGLRVVRGLIWSLLVVAVLSELLGFHTLSVYLAQAVVTSTGVLLLGAFLALVGSQSLHLLLHPQHAWLGRKYSHQTELFNRIHSLAEKVFMLILGVGVFLGFLWAWGVKPAALKIVLDQFNRGVDLGTMRLTALNVILTTVVLYGVFWFSRFLRNFLHARVFPHTGWDMGIQYTISTILQYVILALGILLAINVLGFPLANLALVVGALGVGIGLGLQNIVSNFVSGLVLLIERPIKVGDMLVIDGQWGEVKQIRLRSTIFQTFDRYQLIIPNTELVSSKITNWTFYGRGPNRLSLQVGVSYDVDVKRVMQVLTEVCHSNPRVLKDPAPQIFFQAYGESSLDFKISVYVRVPDDRIPATHEINSAIFDAFKKHGIEIPFPQRDLRIKEWPEAMAKKAEDGEAEEPLETALRGPRSMKARDMRS